MTRHTKPFFTAVGCFTVSKWYLCESKCHRSRVIEIHDVGEENFVYRCPNCGITCSDLDLEEALNLIGDNQKHLLMLPGISRGQAADYFAMIRELDSEVRQRTADTLRAASSLAYGEGE